MHMAYIKHPVVGDTKYGPGKNEFGLKRQALHAYVLGFRHPSTGKYLEFTVGLPEYFKEILSVLGSVKGAELVESVENLMYSEQPDGSGNT